ncbi:MAG: hypothetical protein ABSG41_06485 [Bryobacteraceae bacterium]
MDNTVVVALISSSGSVLIAITALVLNYRGFVSIDGRFASIERRLDLMQTDMKDLNKAMTALEIDVALLKDKAGSR